MKPLTAAVALLMGVTGAHAQDGPEVTPRDAGAGEVRPLEQRVRIVPLSPTAEPSPLPSRLSPPPSPPSTAMERLLERGDDVLETDTTPADGVTDPEDAQREAELQTYDREAARAIAAFDAGDHEESLGVLISMQQQLSEREDTSLLLLLGFAAMHMGREALAIDSMREAVRVSEEDHARSSLVDVLLEFQRHDEAEEAARDILDSPLREGRLRDVAVRRAWQAHDAGRHEQVLALLAPFSTEPTREEQNLVAWAHDRVRQPREAPAPARAPTPAPESPVERYDRIAQTAIRAFDAEDYTTSVEILETLREDMLTYGDVGMMVLLGYAAMHTDREQLSIDAMREAADLTEDNEFFQALIDVLLHFARYDDAERVVERMYPSPERDAVTARLVMINAERAREAGNPEQAHALLQAHQALLPPAGLEALGWSSLERQQFEQAADSFESAYRQTASDDSARGLILSLHPLNRHARLLAIAEDTEGPLDLHLDDTTRRSIAAGHRHFLLDGDTSLEPASAMTAGSVPGTAIRLEPRVRKKRGAPGEGRLSQQGVALQIRHESLQNRLHLELEQQRADSGASHASGQRSYALWQRQLGNGLEGRLGLGSSLSGGEVTSALIGEAGIAYRQAEHGAGARLFRTGNDESLLALGGLRDRLSSEAWGRVLETGAQLDGYLNLGAWSLSGSLTFAELRGTGVADNRKAEFYMQALYPVDAVEGLRVGPELYSSRFQHNLSAFEAGHGGYFSPEYYWRPGLLAAYDSRVTDRVTIQATAGLGWGWSRQAEADGNPLTGEEPGKYGATRESGATYQGRLQADWQLTPNWKTGMRLSGQRSPEYRDWQSGLFIEYHWDR